jgi:hypothetical protein
MENGGLLILSIEYSSILWLKWRWKHIIILNDHQHPAVLANKCIPIPKTSGSPTHIPLPLLFLDGMFKYSGETTSIVNKQSKILCFWSPRIIFRGCHLTWLWAWGQRWWENALEFLDQLHKVCRIWIFAELLELTYNSEYLR